MRACTICKRTILFGGIREGDAAYCGPKCHAVAQARQRADALPPEVLADAVAEVHAGPCPECKRERTVDVHRSYFVWSFVVLTSSNKSAKLSCRSCARKDQLAGLLGSALLGWWGFPFGLILTPIAIVRNIMAMSSGPDPAAPSRELCDIVRTKVGAELQAA